MRGEKNKTDNNDEHVSQSSAVAALSAFSAINTHTHSYASTTSFYRRIIRLTHAHSPAEDPLSRTRAYVTVVVIVVDVTRLERAAGGANSHQHVVRPALALRRRFVRRRRQRTRRKRQSRSQGRRKRLPQSKTRIRLRQILSQTPTGKDLSPSKDGTWG